jgi:hypothetical protein
MFTLTGTERKAFAHKATQPAAQGLVHNTLCKMARKRYLLQSQIRKCNFGNDAHATQCGRRSRASTRSGSKAATCDAA